MSEEEKNGKKAGPPGPPDEGEEIQIEFIDHEEEGPPTAGEGSESASGRAKGSEGGEVEVVLLEDEAELPFGPSERAEEERRSEALAELEDRHLRLRAEFENYRKRVERDREEMRRQAISQAISEVLPALDNLNLAVRSLENEVSPDHWKGLLLVLQQLKESLARLGVEEIAAEGKRFDPSLHEAVNSVVRTDVPPMTVTAVYSLGYTLGGKVIKPARVEVSMAPEGGPAGSEDA